MLLSEGFVAARVAFVARSDAGRKRPINEDSYSCSPRGSYFILADGMGGYESGEVASRLAVDVLSAHFERSIPRGRQGRKRLLEMLPQLVQQWTDDANRAIYEASRSDRTPPGGESRGPMGTTFALLYLGDERGLVAHIGDSRIYRVHQGAIQALTQDHVIRPSELPPDQRPAHLKKRKYLSRSLGTRPEVEADVRSIEVAANDTFILCSDGLTDCVKDEEILRVIAEAGDDLDVAADALVAVANRRGGPDNITVILARVLDEDDTAEVADA